MFNEIFVFFAVLWLEIFAINDGGSLTLVTLRRKLLLDAVVMLLLPVIVSVLVPEKFAAGENETTFPESMVTVMLVFPETV